MNLFNARFDTTNVQLLSDGLYKITGSVIDNTGNYFANNAKVGDIIYMDGSPLGKGVLRYKIDEILSETSGAKLVINASWDIQAEEAVLPFVGASGIIGEKNKKLNTGALTSVFVNLANESLITNVKNYENDLIGDQILSKEPLLGSPLEDGQILSSLIDGTRSWVTLPSFGDAIDLIKGQPNGLATLDENGDLVISQLPAIAITDVFTVDNEEEMLALTAEKGDIAVRTDTGCQLILIDNNPLLASNWKQLSQPIPVSSVNGKTGIIVLTTSDIAEGTNLYYTDERVASAPAVVALQSTVGEKANANEVYTKTEVDVALDLKVNETKLADYLKADGTTEISNELYTPIADLNIATKKYVDSKVSDVKFGDMEKSVYDTDGNGIVDVAEVANSVEYENVQNKPVLSNVATSGSYNDLLNKPTLSDVTTSGSYDDLLNKPEIPTDTASLTKSDVYTKTEVETLMNGTKVLRYSNENGVVLATGEGVTITKSANTAKINCPVGVKIISATIHFDGSEIGASANCSIDFGSNADNDGTGTNSDYTNIIPPMYQVINDVAASRAYKVSPPPAANLNTNAHTLQLTGLAPSTSAWIRLIF